MNKRKVNNELIYKWVRQSSRQVNICQEVINAVEEN